MTQTDDRQEDDAGQDEAGSESKSTKSDLDALLAEFETKRSDGEKAKGNRDLAGTFRELKPVVDFARSELTRRQQEQVDADVKAALSSLKKGEPALEKAPDDLLRGLMEAYAIKDPSFGEAFANRGKSPSDWDKALEKGQKWATDLLKELPGSKVKDDLEAARAAVNGTSNSTSSDDEPNIDALMSMSDQDFEAQLEAAIRKAEG